MPEFEAVGPLGVPIAAAAAEAEEEDADPTAAVDDEEAADGPEGGGGGVGSTGCPAFLSILLMELTEGMLLGSETLCASSWSRISQANMAGFSDLTRRMRFTTDGVATC